MLNKYLVLLMLLFYFLNDTSLSTLNSNNLENLRNTNFKLNDVINEFINNPIYTDQLINKKGTVFSIIIYLGKNNDLIEAKENIKIQLYLKKTILILKQKMTLKEII